MLEPLWRIVSKFLTKPEIGLTYDSLIPLLGIYPEKTIVGKDIHNSMFTAALFTIARNENKSSI